MPGAGSGSRSWLRPGLVWWWPLVLAVVLVWPLLVGSGHPLARDLVFLPTHAWTPAALGLGDGAPRAVPLDAVMAAVTRVVDGGLVARVLLPLLLAAGGWGVLAVLRDATPVARWAAAGLAVWNPYVVERLALGQWALLAAYAALPWLVHAALRFREHGRVRDLGSATLWAALASLTPTGGLLAVAALVAGGAGRTRRLLWLAGAGLALQAPWVAAALAGSASRTSAADAVRVFAPDTQAGSGAVVALLGLGGIWDDASEPATRGTWLALVAALVVVAVVLAGRRPLGRLVGAPARLRWWILGGAGLVLAVAGATPAGQELLRWLVATVPGAGLLRDSQKFLAPTAVLAALSLGALTDRLHAVLGKVDPEVRVSALMPLVALPVLLLPDATTVTWPTVRPVSLPGDFDVVAAAVAAGPADATLVTLPWRSYRGFSWGNGLTSSDPALRWFEADVLVSDDLQVADVLVPGEGRRAAEVGAALRRDVPADALGPAGVEWVVVYPDDPAAPGVSTAGLEPVHLGADVALYRVPGPVTPSAGPPAAQRWAVGAGWVLALLAVIVGAVLRVRSGVVPRPGGNRR